METLYLLRSVADPNIHRIGRSNAYNKRKEQHKVGSKMEEVKTVELVNAYEAEKKMLKHFSEYLLPGQGYVVGVSESELINKMDEICHEVIAGRFHNEKKAKQSKKEPKAVGGWKLNKKGTAYYKSKKSKNGNWYRVNVPREQFEAQWKEEPKTETVPPSKVNPIQIFWMAIAVVVVLKLLMGCTNASEATKIEQQQNQQCLDYFQSRIGVHYAREQCQ